MPKIITRKNKIILHVLLACHNRKEKTLSCLWAVRRQRGLPKEIKVKVTLFDDGSTDGTATVVRREKLADQIKSGDGNYYWCGAMRSLVKGVAGSKNDFILLLNDDTILERDALARLIQTWEWASPGKIKEAIVVGATRSTDRSTITYGGLVRRSGWHPFRYKLLKPGPKPLPCYTFNGNCVLIPQLTMDRLGGLDEHFTHSFGDIDLGLRASQLKIPIWLAPGYLGLCDENKPVSKGKTFSQRWKKLCSPKGFPPLEQLYFSRKHGGFFWPYFWLSSTVRWLIR